MLEEVTPDSLTEVGAADGAVCERFRIEQREDTDNSMKYTNQRPLWWLWWCLIQSPITQHYSHSDGVLSTLLEASQFIHCCSPSSRGTIGPSETVSVVSVGVGDGIVTSSCHTPYQ